jgi:micrococcal nuclease
MKLSPLLLAFTALSLTACFSPVEKPTAEPIAAGWAELSRVIDGDTIEIQDDVVRIIGIDTPEIGECYFSEASTHLRTLLGSKPLVLITQPGENRDKYQRLLRYVHVEEEDTGLRMIQDGYARSYPWFEHPRTEQYREAESEAQNQGNGLWSACK